MRYWLDGNLSHIGFRGRHCFISFVQRAVAWKFRRRSCIMSTSQSWHIDPSTHMHIEICTAQFALTWTPVYLPSYFVEWLLWHTLEGILCKKISMKRCEHNTTRTVSSRDRTLRSFHTRVFPMVWKDHYSLEESQY